MRAQFVVAPVRQLREDSRRRAERAASSWSVSRDPSPSSRALEATASPAARTSLIRNATGAEPSARGTRESLVRSRAVSSRMPSRAVAISTSYGPSMVRRDDSKPTEGRPTEQAESRCASPAGESPARVIAGEPASRPPPEAEMPTGEAWRREPRQREQVRGPQHEVKPAASKDSQREGRAAHVTAKANSTARESGWAEDFSGVWVLRGTLVEGRVIQLIDGFAAARAATITVHHRERRGRATLDEGRHLRSRPA